MKMLFLAGLALATALATSPPSLADPMTYTLAFIGQDGTTATAIVTSDPSGNVLSGTIDVTNAGADALVSGLGVLTPPGVDGSDNTVSPVPPFTTFGGVSFVIGGEYFVNLFADDGGYLYGLEEGPIAGPFIELATNSNDGTYSDDGGTVAVNSTPEPSSFLLLGTGLLGLGFPFWKAKKASRQPLIV